MKFEIMIHDFFLIVQQLLEGGGYEINGEIMVDRDQTREFYS